MAKKASGRFSPFGPLGMAYNLTPWAKRGVAMWFWKRKRKLFEEDPKGLSLDLLHHLQGALTAKLILVHEELQKRYEIHPSFASEVPELEANTAALRRMLQGGFKSPYEL